MQILTGYAELKLELARLAALAVIFCPEEGFAGVYSTKFTKPEALTADSIQKRNAFES